MALVAQLVDDVVVHKFEVESDITFGRKLDNVVTIDDTSVSSYHAVLKVVPNPSFPDVTEYFIEDLGSTNRTELNGSKVIEPVQVRHGDTITVAWNTFKFYDEGSQDLAKTTHLVKD